jgi:hypothetical protein
LTHSAPVKLPAVINAFEIFTFYRAERKRHVAVRTAIQQRAGSSAVVTKKHQGRIEQSHGERLVAQLLRFAEDIPVVGDMRH